MADDRVLRVSAAVDQQSFRSLRAEIADSIREAEKLAQALGQISRGGPSILSAVGGHADTPPAGFGAAQAAIRASQPGGGGTLGMGGFGAAMRNVAGDARQASRQVGDSVREAAASAEPQVRRLLGVVQELQDAMRRLGSASGTVQQRFLPGFGPAPAGSGEQVQLGLPGLPARTGRTLHGLGPGLIPVRGAGPHYAEIPTEAYAPGATDVQKAGFFQRMAGMGGYDLGQSALGRGITGMLPGGTAGMLAKYGPWAAGAYGAYKTYDWMTAAMGRSNTVNAEEKLGEQWYGSNLQAAAGSTFGSMGTAVLGGDLATARAYRVAGRSPEFQRLLSSSMTIRREQLAASARGEGSFTEALTGEKMGSTEGWTVGAIKKSFGSKKDQLITEVSNSWGDVLLQGIGKGMSVVGSAMASTGMPGVDMLGVALRGAGGGMGYGGREDEATRTRQDIEKTRSDAQTPITQLKEIQRKVGQARAADPMFNYVSGNLMSGAQGTMDMLRSAGLGQRVVYNQRYDATLGKNVVGDAIGYSGDRWAAAMTGRGLLGQALQGRGQVAQTAGRGMMGYGDTVASAIAGGFGNAGQVLGLGAQLGGAGGPLAYYRAVQGAQGHGGLDVTAGADLGGFVGGLLRQGHRDIGGAGAFEAIAGAAYAPGSNSAEQVRAAGAMQGGLQHLGELFGGGVDPLGQALTRRAALRAAGNKGPYVADALERLMRNPAEMAQILSKDGQVPTGLQALGITKADVQRVAREQNLQNVVRLVQRGLPAGSVAEQAAKRMIAVGGDVNEAIFGQGGVTRRNMGDKAVDRLMALRRKEHLSGRERAESTGLEQRAQRLYRPEMAGLAELQASDTGEKRSAEEIEAALEAQMGVTGLGRRVRGTGAGDTIGRNAPEKAAAGAKGKLGAQESQEKFNQIGKFKHEADSADLTAVALEKANQQIQGVAGHATQLAATEQAMEVAIAKVAQALNGLAARINSTAPRR